MDRRVGAILTRGPECVGVCGGGKLSKPTGKKKDHTFMFMYWLIEHCFAPMLELQ